MKTVLVKVGVKPSLESVQGRAGDKDMESAILPSPSPHPGAHTELDH